MARTEIVTTCSDCPLSDRSEQQFQWTFCGQVAEPTADLTYLETPPDWCPLRVGPVVVSLKVGV